MGTAVASTTLSGAPNPGGVSLGTAPGLFVLVMLFVGTMLSLIVTFGRSRRRLRDVASQLSADVETGLLLLSSRIEGLAGADPHGDAACALSDAEGRLAAARTLRAESAEPVVSRAVRRILLEGLAAVSEGDRLAGRDPGPPLPPPTPAVITDHAVRVMVAGAAYIAQPGYRPGFPYHYSGGVLGADEAPGGWYASPFWESLVAELSPSS